MRTSGLDRIRLLVGIVAALSLGCSDDETTGGGGDGAGDTGDDASAEVATGDAADTGSGFEYACEPGALEACRTVCDSAGVRQCLKDWGPCVPLAEQCGNCKDDDCNGVIDDSCPEREQCPPPVATCPVAIITVQPGASVDVGATLTLSGAASTATPPRAIASYRWTVSAPPDRRARSCPPPTWRAPPSSSTSRASSSSRCASPTTPARPAAPTRCAP